MPEIEINVDTSQVDSAIEKVNQLVDKLKEAKSLADEMTSLLKNIRLEIRN